MDHIPKLDERLQKVMDFFPACDSGADIGADHGRLSCNLLANGKVRTMQITDISAVSLQKAEKLLTLHHMENRARFSVGDGLKALKSPADAIAVCGMGGEVISDILNDGKDFLYGAVLILCPQTEPELIRKTVSDIGYRIADECAVLASGRRYVVIKAETGKSFYTEKQLFLGPVLMTKKDSETTEYYQWRYNVEKCSRNDGVSGKLKWLTEVTENAECK